MRYGEQVFEIAVPLDDVDWSIPDPLPQIVDRFHRRHEALYTYAMPEQESVLVNARVTVAGLLDELPREPSLPSAPPAPPIATRSIYLDGGAVAAPVFDFDALAPGQEIAGPAIIESAMTTVLLHSGDIATVTELGWLEILVNAR
jgi:N-methylhydantoinase A